MAELLTLDANVLVHAQDRRDVRRYGIALAVVAGLQSANCVFTTITLGQFFHTVSRKFLSLDEARCRLEDLATLVPVIGYDAWHLMTASALADAGKFSFWDAVMLACAEEAGCTICLSEDIADGARLGKLTVRNPFGPKGLPADVRAMLLP